MNVSTVDNVKLRADRGAYYFLGEASYAVLLNRHCGRQARYDVLVTTGDHATYIGRELPLAECGPQVRRFERLIKQVNGAEWTGAQAQVDAAHRALRDEITQQMVGRG